MEKKNKIILIVIILLTLIVVGVCVYAVTKKEENVTKDGLNFQKEYSELNGKINEYTGKENVQVDITKTNTVKYSTEEEINEMLTKDTGIIYLGFSECPWCRTLVTSLTKVAEEKNEPIYYLDIKDIRSAFTVEDGKLINSKKGSDGYYKLLKTLDEHLSEYILADDNGNQFDTKEKRIYVPTLIAVKDGKVTDFHVGTINSQADGNDELNDSQREELEKVITDLINSKNKEVCTDKKC